MVTTAAYMGTFGYLGALLLDVSGVAAAWLPAVLTLFGVGAFVGLTIEAEPPITTVPHARHGNRRPDPRVRCHGAVCLPSGNHHRTGIPARPGGLPAEPGGLGRVYTLAPDAPMLAGATNSSAFQAGLTLAPLLAGLPLSLGHGLPSVGWIGVALGVAALGLAVLDRRLSGQELATSRDRSVRESPNDALHREIGPGMRQAGKQARPA